MSVFDKTVVTGRRMRRASSRLSACAAALMLTYAAGAVGGAPVIGVASAHDVVLHSTPADGETVSAFPRRITLEFSAIPKDTFNTIALSDADTSTVLFSGTPVRNNQMMSIDVPASVHGGNGHYTIGYQITSSDGHATRGKLSFTVASTKDSPTAAPAGDSAPGNPTSEATSSDKAAPSSTADDGTGLSSVIFGGVAIALVVILIVFVAKKRRAS